MSTRGIAWSPSISGTKSFCWPPILSKLASLATTKGPLKLSMSFTKSHRFRVIMELRSKSRRFRLIMESRSMPFCSSPTLYKLASLGTTVMFTFIHYTLHQFTISQLHEMTEFRVPVRNAVLSQHWPPLTRKDIHKYNYTKKNSVCRCAMLCIHNIDHLWHGESAKMSPSTVTHCYSECSLLVPVTMNFYSLSDIDSLIPGYSRHKGRVGSAPS